MNNVNITIETPRGSTGKYVYDEKEPGYFLKKILALGMHFPYDFGMLPNTKAPDGDPIDAMVFTECHTYPGVRLQCRLVGALLARQSSPGKKATRNDRFFFIAIDSVLFRHIKDISEFSPLHNHQLEAFFINYNKVEGKSFKSLGFVGPGKAHKLLKEYLAN